MQSSIDSSTEPSPDSPPTTRPARVVGIGASAGGLESLEHFFSNVPVDTGFAFVIVQHLSPDYRSMMDELLSRHCAMPIHVVQHEMRVQANNVYLLPPRKEMVLENDLLLLNDKDRMQSLTLPIDKFFRSLARDRGQEAVAIILSGTGSDGSRGLRDVKLAGGLVIAEDPATAKFDGMPLSAIATNMVDCVATAKEMPRMLLGVGSDGESLDDELADETPMDKVLRLLHAQSSIDFSFYKTSTVTRRIERRVAIKESSDLAEYANKLATDPDEVESLYHDLLIGVTRFFRDPECFEVLEKRIVPELMASVPPTEELRVWVAGCATGEEAYSIAMILFEAYTAAERAVRVKILATDAHRSSLEIASRGFYGEEQLVHVSDKRRERFFTKKNGAYQVSQELRQLIVFAPHNVTKDAPFTKMHLITCRNLLIYLEASAQNTVLSLFHFGLVLHGILFLGSSESVGTLASEFITVDEHCKFFRKRRDVRLLEPRRLPAPGRPLAPRSQLASRLSASADTRLLWLYDRLLDRHMPPSYLVDDDRQLLDSFAGAERWLRVNRRRPSNDLLDLLSGELRAVTAGAIQQALKNDKPVRYMALPLTDEAGTLADHTLSAEPIANPRTGTRYVLVTLEPAHEGEAAKPAPSVSPPMEDNAAQSASDERLQTLEGELSYARETLQATVEELQTSNEQLQATNEELVASNEELQSTNEELQSVNEELYTVNAEHQKKIAELRELNADMQHLLEGTDIGTLFLDNDLRIRKYTPRIASVFHIQPQDVGRSVSDFSHSLKRESLMSDINEVLVKGNIVEDEVKDVDGGSFFLRILPYRHADAVSEASEEKGSSPPIIGVVITLTDIAALDRARARLAQLSAIVESCDDAIIGTELDGTITSWNQGASRLYGYLPDEVIGSHFSMLAAPPDKSEVASAIEQVVGGHSLEHVEAVHQTKGGSQLAVSMTMSPIVDQDGVTVGVSAIARDITPLKHAQRQLRERGDRIKLLLDSTAEAIFGVGTDGCCTFCNPTCARMLGYDSAELIIGKHIGELIRPQQVDGAMPGAVWHPMIDGVLKTGTTTHSDTELWTRTDGSCFQAEYWSHPVRENGSIVGAVVTFLDVTDRKRAETEIRMASQRREQFLAMLSHELRNPLSAVLNATKLMQSKRADADVIAKARGVIERQAKHMACLLEDLLDVSRITRGSIKLKREPLDVRSAIQLAVEALNPLLREHEIELSLELPDECLVVDGDAARLQQVVGNLLSNAARHSPRGARVTVSAEAQETEVLIKVTDRGSGIQPDILPQIFDLFFQNEPGLDRSKGGLGIGLTVVRTIAELHGGRVTAHSDGLGQGCQFSVWLPLSASHYNAPDSVPRSNHGTHRILVVEDQDDARDMLRLLLEAKGNLVLEAADGASALDVIRRELPDVALVDIGLPTMSGYEVAREVRQDPRLQRVRLIALTGYGTADDVRAARDAGFDNHLTKPTDPDSIERILAGL